MRAKKARAIRVHVIGDEKAHRKEYQLAKRHYATFGLRNSQQPKLAEPRVRKAAPGLKRRDDAARGMTIMAPVHLIKRLKPSGYSFSLWTQHLGWKVRGPNGLGSLPRTMLRLMAIQAVALQGN